MAFLKYSNIIEATKITEKYLVNKTNAILWVRLNISAIVNWLRKIPDFQYAGCIYSDINHSFRLPVHRSKTRITFKRLKNIKLHIFSLWIVEEHFDSINTSSEKKTLCQKIYY